MSALISALMARWRFDDRSIPYVNINNPPGTISSVTFMCNADADCMSGSAPAITPVAGDICWANTLPAGKTKAVFTFHAESRTASALGALVMVNNVDQVTALAQFTRPDWGPQASERTAYLDGSMISMNKPTLEFNTGGSGVNITSFAVGFIKPTGTVSVPCYVTVAVT